LADKLSKLIIFDDWMLWREFFQQLEQRWARHIADLFAYNANNQCARFYSLHWRRISAGENALAFFKGIGPLWIICPFRMLGRVWRKRQNDGDIATMVVPVWQSSTWWGLFARDGVHFAEEVVDWVWLRKEEHILFVLGSSPGGKDVVSHDWYEFAVRVDFSVGGDRHRIPLRDR